MLLLRRTIMTLRRQPRWQGIAQQTSSAMDLPLDIQRNLPVGTRLRIVPHLVSLGPAVGTPSLPLAIASQRGGVVAAVGAAAAARAAGPAVAVIGEVADAAVDGDGAGVGGEVILIGI